ncbi:hypothetical protein HN51_005232, partial [Arachis hypogaea]
MARTGLKLEPPFIRCLTAPLASPPLGKWFAACKFIFVVPIFSSPLFHLHRKVKERSCRLSSIAVDVNHQLLVLTALTQEEMEWSKIIKRCVYFYEEIRS